MNDGFPCTACGICCKQIKKISYLSELDRGDGVCRHLVDNKCSIYDKRPHLCNIDFMFEQHFKQVMSLDEYYMQNLLVCKELQIDAGVPIELQVELKNR